ncbi:transglycosylase SLT domain-containing protein [Pseudokineococcus basanitobsidens]|uniref:Transglycosylase SLT domain-containing protein n=1 Tax=Pseudokineococcus basanitobsidens TaxID=1926649 RepID=A0ABU8RGG4_9ACTN
MSGIAAVQSRLADIQSRLAQLAPPSALPSAAAAAGTSTRTAAGPTGSTAAPSSSSALSSTTTARASSQGFSELLAGLVEGGAAPAAARTGRTTGAAEGARAADGPTGEQLVAAAKDYLGVPYRWGGTDPATGLDCSGLVQRAFKDLGVDVPRVAKDQGRLGEKVPDLAAARPGDLVVMDGGSHIGIYVGGGKMLHAPHRGDVVKISTVWETPTSIRRVLGTEAAQGPGTARASTLDASAARPSSLTGAIRSDVSAAVRRHEPLFAAATQKYDLPAGLLAAVAQQESGGDASAVSPAGARGLMQIMPATARGLGVDPLDPAQAVDGAARLLAQHLRRYDGSVPLALAAYNAGPGAVDRYDGVPPYRETQQYVRKITGALGIAA